MDILNLASEIIKGRAIKFAEAQNLLTADLFQLVFAANKIREHYKNNKINFCSIINAKSGACSQDCKFCAQSSYNNTNIDTYKLVNLDILKNAFIAAKNMGAGCFGIVTSGNELSNNEIDVINIFLKEVTIFKTRISLSAGEIDELSLKKLKESGLKRYHHNIETAESFFPNICTTHSFADRIATVKKVKKAGLEICCGGIFGLGETPLQRLEFAFTLKDLDVDSVPLNFLNPIAGTPMENQKKLSCFEILRIISIFRFILPSKDISVCGGREINLGDLQSWIFNAGANGMMIGGYLTTQGRPIEQDLKMIQDLGLTI